jgi:uncharacterized protein (DUF2267 family)
MDELIKQVAERSGISEDKARTAVNTVVGFLKDRLPASIAGQVDNVLDSSADVLGSATETAANTAGELLGGLGDMFGKK